MRAGLEQAEAMAGMLGDAPPLLAEAARALVGHAALVDLLDRALVAEPPLLARDGGFIAPGFDPELDETRALRDEGRGVIAGCRRSMSSCRACRPEDQAQQCAGLFHRGDDDA
jgi:DNA mismatch repair protein MutS